MELTDKTKKILVYGGGAASILAIILYVKNKNSTKAAAGYAGVPVSGGGAASGGASSDALSAAKLNAATQLAIAQGSQGLQYANIQAQKDVAQTQVAGAVRVAGIQASASNTKAMMAALSTPIGGEVAKQGIKTGGNLIGDLFGLIGKGVTGLVNLFKPSPSPTGSLSAEQQAQIDKENQGYSAPGSSFINPLKYSPTGNILDADNPPALSDYYQGSTGSGDSSWFGIGQGDPNFEGPLQYDPSLYVGNPEFVGPLNTGNEGPPALEPPGGYSGEGIPAGYYD